MPFEWKGIEDQLRRKGANGPYLALLGSLWQQCRPGGRGNKCVMGASVAMVKHCQEFAKQFPSQSENSARALASFVMLASLHAHRPIGLIVEALKRHCGQCFPYGVHSLTLGRRETMSEILLEILGGEPQPSDRPSQLMTLLLSAGQERGIPFLEGRLVRHNQGEWIHTTTPAWIRYPADPGFIERTRELLDPEAIWTVTGIASLRLGGSIGGVGSYLTGENGRLSLRVKAHVEDSESVQPLKAWSEFANALAEIIGIS